MTTYICPNCGQEYSQDDVETGDGVYSDVHSDPYTGMSHDEYFCASCVDEYKNDTNLLKRIFKGNVDRLDFKLRKKQ